MTGSAVRRMMLLSADTTRSRRVSRLGLTVSALLWVWLLQAGASLPAWAADSPFVPMDLGQVQALLRNPSQTNAIAVRFQGTVVYTEFPSTVCVQSNAVALVLQVPAEALPVRREDQVEVEAYLRFGDSPLAVHAIRKVGTGPLPQPNHPWLVEALNGEFQGRLMDVEGVVMQTRLDGDVLSIHLTDRSGWAVANVFKWTDSLGATNWWGARLRLRAANVGRGHRAIRVESPADILVLQGGAASLFGAPLTSASDLRALSAPRPDRLRVQATVLEADQESVLLRSGDLAFSASYLQPFAPGSAAPSASELLPNPIPRLRGGDRVDLVGSPLQIKPYLAMSFCSFRLLGSNSPAPPRLVDARSVAAGLCANDLVRVSGRLVDREQHRVENIVVDVLKLEADGIVFQAEYALNRGAPLPVLHPEDVLAITALDVPNPAAGHRLRIRRAEDVQVVYRAPSLTRSQIVRTAGIACGLLAVAGIWIILLRAQVRQRTAALAKANRQLAQSAEEVRQSEAKFRTLFESGTTAVAIHDERGVLDCNPACLTMFGYRRDQFIGQHPADFSMPRQPDGTEARDGVRHHMSEALRKGWHQFEWLARRSDDSPMPVEIVLARVQLDGRTVLQALIHDITRHKQTEEKASRSEAVTRSINYFATSLLERDSEDEILWDLAQKCVAQLGFADCVVYILDRRSKLLLQKAAYGPKNPAEGGILNPITIALGQGIVGSVAATGLAEVIPDTRKDPRYIIDDAPRLSEIAVPIIANNEVLGVIDSEHPDLNFFTREHLEVLTSIASLCANKLVRIRAEERLRALNAELERRVAGRTQELAAANDQLQTAQQELLKSLAQEKELSELKTRFVSMVSHEFRTPVAIIMSSAEILEAYLDRLTPEDRAANLKDIVDATRHMSSMVDEVLVLSRFEAGKLSFRPGALDVVALSERLVDEVLSATNQRCPIELAVSAPRGTGFGDEALLRHILTNLLQNAVKYSPPGVTVRFALEAEGREAVFTVRDRGIGIPEADLRQLFTAFHRGSNVGDRPGTGLGMAIVKSCIELHKGTITLSSQEGRGTTFIVRLPLFPGRDPGPEWPDALGATAQTALHTP